MKGSAHGSPNGSEGSLGNRKHLFSTLDGMRGVAALAVVLIHMEGHAQTWVPENAYLAVDFFFALSGFVLAHAYQTRLDAGWRTTQFLKVRLARLYPLCAVSLLLGTSALRFAHDPVTMGGRRVAVKMVMGLLLLPTYRADQMLFPLNFPMWTIAFELAGNAFHALLLRRRSRLTLLCVCLAAACGVVVYGQRAGTLNYGAKWGLAPGGVYRLLFSYVTGMLVYTVWKRHRTQLRVPALAMPAVLAAVLGAPLLRAPYLIPFQLVVVLGLFPVLLFASARVQGGPTTTKVFRFLGAVSFPVYLLHMPLLTAMQGAWMRWEHHPMLQSRWAFVPYFAVLVPLAMVAERYVDVPARGLLLRWMGVRVAAKPEPGLAPGRADIAWSRAA